MTTLGWLHRRRLAIVIGIVVLIGLPGWLMRVSACMSEAHAASWWRRVEMAIGIVPCGTSR